MHTLVINLLDILSIAHTMDWFFTAVHPVRNNKLTGFLNTVCAPMNSFVSRFASMTVCGNRLDPSALSVICLAFARLAVSALV